MTRYRVFSVFALLAALLLAYFVWSTELNPNSRYAFKLGLDLAGGTELIYRADTSATPLEERSRRLKHSMG